jgi:transposase InsO family protein
MPWLETDVRDQRIQFVMAARRPGANVRALCEAFGISRKTGYKWLAREAAAGSVAALGDRSRRPHGSPARTSAAVTARVLALRDTFGWGGAKLAQLLAADGLSLAPRTIDRIIQREGRTRDRAVVGSAPQRFERAAPNDLWQIDAKGPYALAAGGRCHPLSILDDHSRFAVGLHPLPRLSTEHVTPALRACFERYGVPAAMLMDHGTPWWASGSQDGLTRVSVALLQQGIRVIYGAIRHPQTQGKVERFHRTLDERLRWDGVPTTWAGLVRALAAFREEYNHVRPHAALGLRPPADRFVPSRHAYQPRPRPWVYPTDTLVRRIQANGIIRYAGQVRFVSEALIGEHVALLPLGDRVLVQYRHMYVREWHLTGGRSVALLQPAYNDEWPADPLGPTGHPV